jgi:hypothetical protein
MKGRLENKDPISPRKRQIQWWLAVIMMLCAIFYMIYFFLQILWSLYQNLTANGTATPAGGFLLIYPFFTLMILDAANHLPALLRGRGRPAGALLGLTEVENAIALLWNGIASTTGIFEHARQSLEDALCLMVELHLMRQGIGDVCSGAIRKAVREALWGEHAPETASVDLAAVVNEATEDILQQ